MNKNNDSKDSIFVLIETADRTSVMIGTYENHRKAMQEMSDRLYEHLEDSDHGDMDEDELEKIRKKLNNAVQNQEGFHSDKYEIGTDSAWSNNDEDCPMDWNIFEIKTN